MSLAAVDLGASSGRVMLGDASAPGVLEPDRGPPLLERPGAARRRPLHWDILRLYREILAGLRAGAAAVDAIGIDSWAVDYGLLDARRRAARQPGPLPRRPHRRRAWSRCCRVGPADELYAITGLQQLPFNTIYQLAAETARWIDAATLLLIPDLLGLLAHRRGRRPSDERLDHPAVRRPRARLERRRWPRGSDVPPRLLPRAAGARRRDRAAAACGGRGRPGSPARPGDRGRVARHRSSVVAVPAAEDAVRLHLLGHLVAGRAGAGRAGADRRGAAGELHQRGRRRRHDPVPAQRDGPVDPAGVPARSGATDDLPDAARRGGRRRRRSPY